MLLAVIDISSQIYYFLVGCIEMNMYTPQSDSYDQWCHNLSSKTERYKRYTPVQYNPQ